MLVNDLAQIWEIYAVTQLSFYLPLILCCHKSANLPPLPGRGRVTIPHQKSPILNFNFEALGDNLPSPHMAHLIELL
jgi:hypothetical protein